MSAPERVTLRYVGEQPVEVGFSVNPDPVRVEPGESVEVDAWGATSLLASGAFVAGDGRDDGILRGEALDVKLAEYDLPRGGTADQKRARIAELESALAAQAAVLEAGAVTTDHQEDNDHE